jgi:DNA-binding NtrC family response regulator
MTQAPKENRLPFNLVVTGEAQHWLPALQQIVGANYLLARPVVSHRELLAAVEAKAADAAVLDDSAAMQIDVLHLLRLIRRLDNAFPVVVVVTGRRDRHWLEDALRLAAFSVVTRPLQLEELLRQIQRMMRRIDEMIRRQT